MFAKYRLIRWGGISGTLAIQFVIVVSFARTLSDNKQLLHLIRLTNHTETEGILFDELYWDTHGVVDRHNSCQSFFTASQYCFLPIPVTYNCVHLHKNISVVFYAVLAFDCAIWLKARFNTPSFLKPIYYIFYVWHDLWETELRKSLL